jgi:2'-5' RNA ligase
MELLAVAYPVLSRADYNLIEKYRRDNDPQQKIIKPHITLVFPVVGIPVPEFIQEISKQIENIRSIPFSIASCALHKDLISGNYYAFLVPDEGYEKIKVLHEHVYTGSLLAHKQMDIPFIPHMTIGASSDETNCQNMVDLWNEIGSKIQGLIAGIDIIMHKDGEVTHIENIELL